MRKKCSIRLRRLTLWMLACQTGGITGEPGDGARVLYFKKERDE